MLTNIAYYKFVPIENVQETRQKLFDYCCSLGLKGTIILGTEGINSCLVGTDENIDQFIQYMQLDSRFSDIHFKKSYSELVPFRRMIVKIKKEIIPIGFDWVKPHQKTAPHLEPMEFKKWYENNKDMVVLDTRNDYEVEMGTFRNAVNPNLKEFKDFPQWIQQNFLQYKNKPVVTFCTGGIRCEKATAYMMEAGFQDVYQVKGGILNYFDETLNHSPGQDNYYDGDCFVFDNRVAIDKNLKETNYTICYHCWHTLKKEDLVHPNYNAAKHCHYCYDHVIKKQTQQNKKCAENNLRAFEIRKQRAAEVKAQLGLR